MKKYAFEKNENGHVVISIRSRRLTGGQEVGRLKSMNFVVEERAEDCLKSELYNTKHRFVVTGQLLKIAIVTGRELVENYDLDDTAEAARKFCMKKFGYGKPFAGMIPAIREFFSGEQVKLPGISNIVSAHDPIVPREGNGFILYCKNVPPNYFPGISAEAVINSDGMGGRRIEVRWNTYEWFTAYAFPIVS